MTANENKYVITFQLIRDQSDAVLGGVRVDRPGEFRTQRNQDLHEILGDADVRYLLSHQYRRSPEPTDRHDEPFVSADIGE